MPWLVMIFSLIINFTCMCLGLLVAPVLSFTWISELLIPRKHTFHSHSIDGYFPEDLGWGVEEETHSGFSTWCPRPQEPLRSCTKQDGWSPEIKEKVKTPFTIFSCPRVLFTGFCSTNTPSSYLEQFFVVLKLIPPPLPFLSKIHQLA